MPSVRYKLVLVVVGLLGLAVTFSQFYHGLSIAVAVADPSTTHWLSSSSGLRRTVLVHQQQNHRFEMKSALPFIPSIPSLPRNESFGACLMLKEDNDLLWEWLAYHYTVLPLRYVFVGSDLGNIHDPNDVLQRWTQAKTGLQFWIVNATQFIFRFADFMAIHKHEEDEKEFAHHYFIHRQRGFVTTCTEFFRSMNVSWVTFIDSDEFLVLNRIGEDDEEYLRDSRNQSSLYQLQYQLRQALPPLSSPLTVRQVIDTLQSKKGFSDVVCYTMPRLLYGALENRTCPAAKDVNALARTSFNFSEMSTLRFVQTARRGDFSTGRFGKVLVDVSRLQPVTLLTEPRNVHRPFVPECKRAVAHFPSSIFYLNHYVGSWERYNSRKDARRSRELWEPRAYKKQTGLVCDKGVHEWLPRFVQQVGMKRAQYLLGATNDIT